MKAPDKKEKISQKKTILLNQFGKPIKPYKPRTPYSARNPYSNRRSWEEIQRRNQLLKDNGQWDEQSAFIGKLIGWGVGIVLLIVIYLLFGMNGLAGAFGGPKNLFD